MITGEFDVSLSLEVEPYSDSCRSLLKKLKQENWVDRLTDEVQTSFDVVQAEKLMALNEGTKLVSLRDEIKRASCLRSTSISDLKCESGRDDEIAAERTVKFKLSTELVNIHMYVIVNSIVELEIYLLFQKLNKRIQRRSIYASIE